MTVGTDYEQFVTAHERSLRRTAFLLCGDWARAEDATQDALVKIYLRWSRLDHGPALRTYAHRAVSTSVIDQSRRPWRREVAEALPEVESTGDPDRRLVVLAALQRLPGRRRACVVLRYFADLPVDDVAQILGITAGTVKSQTARAIDQLRDELAINGLDLALEDT